MKYKVTRHVFRNGFDDSVKYTFNSYEEAMAYVKKSEALKEFKVLLQL
mgnify:CR=1 FL=1